MSYITAFGIANPPTKVAQQRIANFMVRAMKPDYINERKLRAVFKSSGIDFRYSVLEDYNLDNNYSFFPGNNTFEPFPSTKKRSEIFQEHALALSLQAIRNAIQDATSTITHLITVCCTGMYAPGLDIDIMQSLRLSPNIHRLCINFMGCYAAMNALQTANEFCRADPSAKVLIVCTELCSLHFQKEVTDDNILSNALFADGAAAVLMEAATTKKKALMPVSFHMDLMPEGDQDMAWSIGNFGFEMKLTTYVPTLIEKGITDFTTTMLGKFGLNLESIKFLAIHPGGKRILKVIEKALNIPENKNKFAYSVLRNYGNMSSPTVLFVLNEIFKSVSDEDHNEHVLSFAFGPGLTLGSLLLQIKTR